MARPLSEDKRNAILAAAADAVGASGVEAATAKIARAAGVAEGTLFTYFASKDELLNQLYLDLKTDLRDAIIAGYPADAGIRERCRHLWDRYIGWGAAHASRRKAMRHLTVSDRITDDSRKTGAASFQDIAAMLDEGVATRLLRQQPVSFVGAIMEAMAEMTLEFIAREPDKADRYTQAGFDAFWGAIATP